MSSRYLRTGQAADYLDVSASFLEKARLSGRGPIYMQAQEKGLVRYAVDDLDAWLMNNRRNSTSQPHAEPKQLRFLRLMRRQCKTSRKSN